MKNSFIRIKIAIIASATMLLVGGGCQEIIEPGLTIEENQEVSLRKDLSPDEIQIVNQLKETTELFSTLIHEVSELPEIIEEATLLKYEGQHRVLAEELLDPNSALYRLLGEDKGGFLKAKKSDPNMRTILDIVKDIDIDIYWPYVDEKQNLNSITLTYNPLDNENENIGFRFIKSGGKYVLKDTVLVDDDYAFQNAVLIFDKHEYLDDADLNSRKYTEINGANANVLPCCSNVPLDGSNHINKLYVRNIRLSRNFRGLFGGENELRFHSSSDFISVTNPNAKNQFSTFISRSNGRRSTWVNTNRVLEANWQIHKPQRVLVIESVDTTSDRKVEVNATAKYASKVKVDKNGITTEIGPEVSVGVKYTLTRKSEFTSIEMDRNQFFFENWSNADSQGIHNFNAIRLHEFDRKNGKVWYTYGVSGYNYPN